ncbi:hypothetical protein WA1_38940 [Scytonema hofmannii PCC 7110]|uniref:N-acetyltransferase domain-containing protein n=1 Tax=Scytonema hofmannii PCC 7110 TaxID=128403 RepID=A0A139X0X2_9CYAN|nr:GNAT family N-acetyltransferase [Scytonema hofmannii]KYC38310.1 hypothetical protein WA1_38940 [Scytonema hofmannii PCC 7110]
MSWIVSPLNCTGHTRSSLKKILFNCGSDEGDIQLNNYLKQYAWINHESGLSKTFVAHSSEDSKNIVGYYSSSMSNIEPSGLPDNLKNTLPAYPIPVMLIGKLAVDQQHQSLGVGKRLLKHAIETVLLISDYIGVYAIRIDSKNEKAKKYYVEKRGFLSLQDSLTVILPLSVLKKLNLAIKKEDPT